MKNYRTGNLMFHDMSNGLELTEADKTRFINMALDNLKDGQCHTSISTGNFVVIGLKYDTIFEIWITENYKVATIYRKDGNPTIEEAFAYELNQD